MVAVTGGNAADLLCCALLCLAIVAAVAAAALLLLLCRPPAKNAQKWEKVSHTYHVALRLAMVPVLAPIGLQVLRNGALGSHCVGVVCVKCFDRRLRSVNEGRSQEEVPK